MKKTELTPHSSAFVTMLGIIFLVVFGGAASKFTEGVLFSTPGGWVIIMVLVIIAGLIISTIVGAKKKKQ